MLYLLAGMLLSACETDTGELFGSIEYQRLELRAPAFEQVIEITAGEGEGVDAGAPLLRLDPERARQALEEASAGLRVAQADLARVRAGTREEQVGQARAVVAAANAVLADAEAEYQRQTSLVERQLTSRSAADAARAVRDSARADRDRASAALQEQLNGATVEELDQAISAVELADTRIESARIRLRELQIRAPVDGWLDDLLVEVGDRPRQGDTLAIVLVPPAFVRFYLPQELRARYTVGDRLTIRVDGREAPLTASLRWVANEASFTPYYALNERDRGHLSYLAEAVLDEAGRLPAGFPAQVVLADEQPGSP